jgi:zinc D-Ala-D-Ala carboxypeptidase
MPSAKGNPKRANLEEEPLSVKDKPAADWSGIRYFLPKDFSCKCEGLCDHPIAISMDLVTKLDAIRHLMNRHIIVLSGTRCERHNRKIGGAPQSAHICKNGVSHAADIHCPDNDFRMAFVAAAVPLFGRIGIGKDFIHVDDDPELPASVMWVYGPERTL